MDASSAPREVSRYTRFYVAHARFASLFTPARPSDVCRFLWLFGQYSAWSRNPRTPIHRSARALFESDASELAVFRESLTIVNSRSERAA
jgi:hypothetical protein